MPIRVGAAISTRGEAKAALAEAVERARAGLGGAKPDLAFLFVSAHHAEAVPELAARTRAELAPGTLLGCTAQGVIGEEREVEEKPAIAVWAASLPGASIRSFSLKVRAEEETGTIEGFPDPLPPAEEAPALLLLADPFSFPVDDFLRSVGEARPGLPILGGMASGAVQPGMNRLILDDEIVEEGAVAAVVSGAVEVRPLVSQGCRPIGKPFVITKCDRNVIYQLAGKTAVERLQEVLQSAGPEDLELARHALHVGVVVDEYRRRFSRGDFLVRNVLGADAKQGALAVGDRIRLGQTVQFHVRDAASADEDLRILLEAEKKERGGAAPSGALLFTCNGRGTNLFPAADHDASLLREVAGPVPLAGFFAAGEIGPIGSRTFLHGFTASLALFYERRK